MMNIEDMANMPNGVGRHGKAFKTPGRNEEDKIRHELNLIQDAAKRVQTDLRNGMRQQQDSHSQLPQIGLDDKRKILNELGLKNINKIKNVNALMKQIGSAEK